VAGFDVPACGRRAVRDRRGGESEMPTTDSSPPRPRAGAGARSAGAPSKPAAWLSVVCFVGFVVILIAALTTW